MVVLPLINDISLWMTVAFIAIALIGTLILRSSPVPILAGLLATPVVSAALHLPTDVTLSLAAIVLVVIIKRLTAPRSEANIRTVALLVNRLLFDRDIRDRKQWLYRKSASKSEGDCEP